MKRLSEDGNGHAMVAPKKIAKHQGVSIGYHGSRKGEREEMQDFHVLFQDFSKQQSDRPFCEEIKSISFYGIYDGHGGSKAAQFAGKHLHQHLLNRIPRGPDQQSIEQSLKRWFIESYKQTDEEFLKEATKVKPVWKDGTTVTSLLLINRTLFVANIGDSKAILCRYKPEEKKEIGVTLTKDHSPQVYEERMRIQKAGGVVKDGRVLGQLEVSRSIGDGQFKKHGLVCTPDLRKCVLTANDRYILLACDGLWKAFTNPKAVEFIAAKLETYNKDETIAKTDEKSREDVIYEKICNDLAAEAVRKGCEDNVTVLIIKINQP